MTTETVRCTTDMILESEALRPAGHSLKPLLPRENKTGGSFRQILPPRARNCVLAL
jgi:hypothetical protein